VKDTFPLFYYYLYFIEGVNGDEHHKKGHGHKVSHRDGIHHPHRDVGRSSSFSKHIDRSSHHSKKHGIKKHNKHNKHHDGKKHHSDGKIHHHH